MRHLNRTSLVGRLVVDACVMQWGSTFAQTTEYTYDEANRLISANYNNGETIITYSYDAAGNILAKTIDTDTDGDGVPDGQDAFPDDPAEWDDTDSDGWTNLQEFQQGTDPQDAASFKALVASDQNGDGKSDILFRHAVSGQIVYWPMNGAQRLSNLVVDTVSDANWQVVDAN